MKRQLILVIVLMYTSSLFAAEILPLDENSVAYKTATRLSQHMSVDENSGAYSAAKRLMQAGKNETDGTDKVCDVQKPYILVFVSSSMPRYLLKELAEESFKITGKALANVDFILRGVPEMGLEAFRDQINPENRELFLRIDPFIYNRLNITQVPVVIIDRKFAIDSPASISSAIKLIDSGEYERLIHEMEHL